MKTLQQAQEGISRITCLAWSPNNRRLAACTADRVIHLFDENGEKRDKFSTKPADAKGPKNYTVNQMAWSPDSSKLAVAQSDNIVFIYKLGLDWGEKKSICNKFLQNSPVTCVCWPLEHPNEIVFGLAEGKVKLGLLRSNKAQTLYSTDSYVVSVCSSPDGHSTLSGHVDGSVYRFSFEEAGGPSQIKLVQHTCTPQALAWGESIVAGGSDGKVVFYDPDGQLLQLFDYSSDPAVKEFSVGSFNPSGESVVLGSYNRLDVFNYNVRRNMWEEAGVKMIENMYTVTALGWKLDGSRLTVGNLTGAIDMYDACIRRHRYKGKFEFTYVSLSQVIVKRLSSGTRIVLKSHFGYEILKINVYKDQYLIAHTPETLLIGDLDSCKLSEVPWSGSGTERFVFDNALVCMVYNAGELSLVEYGRNEILGSARTEHVSPHLISVRLNECRRKDETEDNKKIAYLIDMQTIRCLDLVTGIQIATISHNSKIDWLELNPRARKLLFRDKQHHLHLFDIATQTRNTLLNYCNYVQWVPNSDVVVAQNRDNLCVWYSIDAPERVTIFQVKGDVEDIERSKGRTEVIVDEGINTVSYTLDETLIEFGSSIDQRDYERAVFLLEQLELTPETEALWQTLSHFALQDKRILIAERCFAALGDVCKARYLHQVNELAQKASAEIGGDGYSHFTVQARMAMLNREFKRAEILLLEQGKTEEAMEMYQELHRWDEAIQVAESKDHPETETLKTGYYQWLMESNQEERAAQLKEAEGDIHTAIQLYIQGGLPARAATLALAPGFGLTPEMFDAIAAALERNGLHEKAGEFYEKNGQHERALQAYQTGHAYRRAVDLARRMFPKEVINLERQWGDWLVHNKQLDAAVNHYIESGQYIQAIESAISARQWTKAVQIVDSQDPEIAKKFYQKIAQHFQELQNYEVAEKYYVKAQHPQEAVDMYIKAGKWAQAHSLAMTYMSEDKVARLYIEQAQRMESAGRLKEAENLYLMVNEPDLAINMYKKNRHYDNMIRLVSQHREGLLQETHLHLAQQLETEMHFREAERHYIEAKDWKSAVNMCRANDMWDDAIRIAKAHGGANASKQVAYAWAVYLGGEAGAKLLQKFGLIEQAIDYATESNAFEQAFSLARASMKSKLPEVHLKHAMFLEDEGRFKEAEAEFITAKKPKEAIDMYMHQQEWISAMRVAENHEPSAIDDVLCAQAKSMAENNQDLSSAEQLYIRAKKPDLAFKMYKDARKMQEAMRVVKNHMPHRMHEFQHEMQTVMRQSAADGGDMDSLTATARAHTEQGNYSLAIDAYLKVTQDVTKDLDLLEEIWENAVKLAMNRCQDRIGDVVGIVSKRLIQIKRYEQAAELYEGIEAYKEAIDVYILGGMWDKARLVCEQAPQFNDYVGNKHRAFLGGASVQPTPAPRSGGMASMTNPDMQGAAERGDWERCLSLAQSQGQEAVDQYCLMHGAHLIKGQDYPGAVHVFFLNGAPLGADNLKMYNRLVQEVLSRVGIGETCLTELRHVLQRLVENLKGANTDAATVKHWERLLQVVHLMALKTQCSGQSEQLNALATKMATSLVRFCDIVPADRLFCEAGLACRDAKRDNMAFVFLNRYLDIADAMEEADSSMTLENSDFDKSDIPFDFALPERPFLNEAKREAIREWVLTVSMDQKVECVLGMRNCEKCNQEIYEGCLKCPNCKNETVACIVTGYPIARGQRVSCHGCNQSANKDDWNRYLLTMSQCPWCGNSETPVY